MTLGVRVVVENDAQEILLVRHTYVPGWYFPGGGVEVGETAEDAAKKELLEETGFNSDGKFILLGAYYNKQASRRDHVLLYKCENWSMKSQFVPNREIAEIGFFHIDALPEETTAATRRRVREIYAGLEISEHW
ncbi:MAG: NUDIX domain-containing protein [Rhizobiaceae bacterium]